MRVIVGRPYAVVDVPRVCGGGVSLWSFTSVELGANSAGYRGHVWICNAANPGLQGHMLMILICRQGHETRVGSRLQESAVRPGPRPKIVVRDSVVPVVKNPPTQKCGAEFWAGKIFGRHAQDRLKRFCIFSPGATVVHTYNFRLMRSRGNHEQRHAHH